MKTFQFETCLSVADYAGVDGHDAEEAFDSCSQDVEAAQKQAINEIQDLAPRQPITVRSVEFQEFDSGNWTHATAYFTVTVEGTDLAIDLFTQAYEQMYGEEET